ncbi:MAG TPA: 5'/3'-nucleotidase SurE [Kiritimatiellia bacterium]|nr:5'/3'-nucleotidase SurE [Kiritimatiellia bacterium]HMO97761.1 5'/3'-nucleotidase SurE [Kiritimatiellia bacterium]HMP95400.1 5'/3'-nucleotidase SurE [Kiritimatiellia bacterium]
MKILLSNDDGIHAPGLSALYEAVKDLGDVVVAAPDSQMSAVGHAITISDPIKVAEINRPDGFRGYAIGGTPADCVKLAVEALLESPPDLIISGINLGPNAGISVIYSGTVSAATEGAILGIPSMAVSLCTFKDPLWETSAKAARIVAAHILRHGVPPDTLVNVNVPNCPYDEIRGYAITTMGRSQFKEVFHRRTDPRGNVYYWMDGEMELSPGQSGTDVQALEAGCVSITPLHFDLTHREVLSTFQREWKLER